MAEKYKMISDGVFTKDGHTMFSADVLSDLQRKSHLEECKKLKDQLSEKQIQSACLSYRHDFGLMGPIEKEKLKSEAQRWFSILKRELFY